MLLRMWHIFFRQNTIVMVNSRQQVMGRIAYDEMSMQVEASFRAAITELQKMA